MEEVVVSFVIPVYNTSAAKVKRCIDSIRKINSVSYEILLIDDGSKKENSIEYEEYMYQKNERYFFQENKGVSVARNLGIKKAIGKYVTFVDADDYILPTNIKLASFEKKKELIIYNVEIGGNKSKDLQIFGLKNLYPTTRNLLTIALEDGIINWAVSKFFLKENLLKRHIKFDETISSGEDLKFVTDVLFTNPSLEYIPKIFYHYDLDPDSSVKRILDNPEKSVDDVIKLYYRRVKIADFLGMKDHTDLKKDAINSLFGIYANCIVYKGKIGDKILKKINQFINETAYKYKGKVVTIFKIKSLKNDIRISGKIYIKIKKIYYSIRPFKF